MVRLLRWATFLVLILVIIGAAFSYPLLRDRFFAPMLAAPANSIEVLATMDATAQPTNTARPTLPALTATTAPPAVIIEAPSPTASVQSTVADTPTAQNVETPTPFAIATTSLLPASSAATTITPMVLGPSLLEVTSGNNTEELTNTTSATVVITTASVTASNAPAATTLVTASIGIAVPVTPATPTPTLEAGLPAAEGEKGYEAPLETPIGSAAAIVTTPTPAAPLGTVTPIVVAPIDVTPILVTTVEITPSTDAAEITPVVAITVALTPLPDTPTPLPQGPTARAESPLYGGPDFNAAMVGQVAIGEQLTIVGIYTEGTWYLLVNGMWIPGAVVDNAPLTLPLVSPTITPVPSSTPTVTPTPLPTATPLGSATPTPTPTSLEQPVCDCSGDTLDCLGNIFANRTQAQQCFEYCFRQTGLDIHLLDPNLNGMACENLP